MAKSIEEREGWAIFDVGGHEEIQRDDEAGLLPDDDEALRCAERHLTTIVAGYRQGSHGYRRRLARAILNTHERNGVAP